MKHHFNALLQRKRIEFEGTDDARKRPREIATDTAKLHAEDGYDWLQQIRRAQPHQSLVG